MKKAFVYLSKESWRIAPAQITKDGFEVMYLPVYITSGRSDPNQVGKLLLSALNESGKTIDLGDFPGNKDAYTSYTKCLTTELMVKSLDELQKKCKEAIVEYYSKENRLKVTLLRYHKTGSTIEKDKIFNFDLNNNRSMDDFVELLIEKLLTS